jgi:cytochrome P450
MYEMTLVLATLFSRLDLRLASTAAAVTERRGVVLAPAGGVPIVVTARRAAVAEPGARA